MYLFELCFFPQYMLRSEIAGSNSSYIFVFLSFTFLQKQYIFFFYLATLGLRCCVQYFSSCSEWASHCGGFSCCSVVALGHMGTLQRVLLLQRCGSRAHGLSSLMHGLRDPTACGIVPDQGLNLCLLPWQADS